MPDSSPISVQEVIASLDPEEIKVLDEIRANVALLPLHGPHATTGHKTLPKLLCSNPKDFARLEGINRGHKELFTEGGM